MNRFLVILALCATTSLASAQNTMRVDYHSGNSDTEMFSLDRLILEPLPWPAIGAATRRQAQLRDRGRRLGHRVVRPQLFQHLRRVGDG